MYPVTSWHCVPPVSGVSGRSRTKTADPALAVKGSGLSPALSSDQTRNTRFPSAASTYDIDSEHAYIMAQALCSYREHRRRETAKASGPAGLLRQYTKAAGPVSPPRDDHVAGSRDVTNTPGPQSRSEYRLPARDRRYRSAVGSTSPAYSREPLMLVMTRTRRPRTAGGVQMEPLYEPDRVDAIEQVGAANAAARVHRPNIGRHLQRTSLVWPFTMDKIGQKERGASGTPNRYQCESTCFASTSSPRKQFTIHPDWVSENLTVAKINLKERTSSVPQCDMTGSLRRSTGITGYPMRRCCSAPPSRTRNPITWEYN